jgi:hypothetical protein
VLLFGVWRGGEDKPRPRPLGVETIDGALEPAACIDHEAPPEPWEGGATTGTNWKYPPPVADVEADAAWGPDGVAGATPVAIAGGAIVLKVDAWAGAE